MFVRHFCSVLIAWAIFNCGAICQAQLSKANAILIDRGLQIQGLIASTGDLFHLNTYTAANYSTVAWAWDTDLSQLGAAPGVPWSRWVDDLTNMPPTGGDAAYFTNCVSLSLSDEPYMDVQSYFTKMTNWLLTVQSNYPNTILYVNNWGGEVSDGTLSAFIAQGHPDMITFDQYSWQSDPNTGIPYPGPPTGLYAEMRRYRFWASYYNIPYGIYRQTYHAVEGDGRVMRNPSGSELRLNTMSAMAFNAKLLADFTYNSGASSLFDRNEFGQWAGDTITNALYNELVEINLRARNLGKALVKLRPIPEQASGDGHTTSIMIVRGKTVSYSTTNMTPVPSGFVADPDSPTGAYTDWNFAKNDPYMSGFQAITNNGTKNAGVAGDVIISWFRPLDNSMLPTNATNQIYMMVVNGLTDTNGSSADCTQTISLDFSNLPAGTNSVVMLNPLTGLLQTNTLPVVNTKRRLTMTLAGGDATLFKFHDGTAFMGFVPPQAPKLTAQFSGSGRTLKIDGRIGDRCRVEWSSSLTSSNWTVLTNLVLPNNSCTLTDSSAGGNQRYYRAVAAQ